MYMVQAPCGVLSVVIQHSSVFKNAKLNALLFQDKVMLGTDYPFPLGELEPGTLIESMREFDGTLKVPGP